MFVAIYQIVRFIGVLSFICLISAKATNAETESSAWASNSFEPATVIKHERARYPTSGIVRRHAGVVEVVYSTDKEGNVIDAVALRSSDEVFEKAALQAVKQSQIEPAKYNGMPVESVRELRVLFKIENQRGIVTREFKRLHQRTLKKLSSKKPDQEEIARGISVLENKQYLSFYGLRFLYQLKSYSAVLFGTRDEQSDMLEKLKLFNDAAHDEGKYAKDDSLSESVRRSIFQTYALSMRLVEADLAFREYAKSARNIPKAISALNNNVQALLDGIQTIKTPLNFSKRNYDLIRLARRGIRFEVETGAINEIVLRCAAKYAKFEHELGAEYQIPTSWGPCWLEVVAEPETEASVLFYRPGLAG